MLVLADVLCDTVSTWQWMQKPSWLLWMLAESVESESELFPYHIVTVFMFSFAVLYLLKGTSLRPTGHYLNVLFFVKCALVGLWGDMSHSLVAWPT